jgi:hypothetical protein
LVIDDCRLAIDDWLTTGHWQLETSFMAETYDQYQVRMCREARRRQEAADTEFARDRLRARGQGWVQGYEAGKKEQAEREVSKRWHDVIFAFLVGAICGFVAAAILNWAAN